MIDSWGVLLDNAIACVAYAAVSIVVLVVGYAVVDLLTPGKLHELIWRHEHRGAAFLAAGNALAVGIIVRQAILSSDDASLVTGLVSTIVYALIGILFQAIAFLVVDALTPGKLGEQLVAKEISPALWVTVASNLAVAIVTAAAIS